MTLDISALKFIARCISSNGSSELTIKDDILTVDGPKPFVNKRKELFASLHKPNLLQRLLLCMIGRCAHA